MTLEEFNQFQYLVLQELELQQQLREISEQDVFIILVVKLGKERGFNFTAEDVEAALRASRRTWLERHII